MTQQDHYQDSVLQQKLEEMFPGIFQMTEEQFDALKTYYAYRHLIPVIQGLGAFTLTELRETIREDYGYKHSYTTITRVVRLLFKDQLLKFREVDSGMPKKAQVYWVADDPVAHKKAKRLINQLAALKKYPKETTPKELEEKSYLLAKAQMQGFARARAEKVNMENPAIKIHEVALKTATKTIGQQIGKEMALGIGATLPKREPREKPKTRLKRVKESLDRLHGVFENPDLLDALEEKNEKDTQIKTCKECGHKFLASESGEYCLVCYEKKLKQQLKKEGSKK